MRESLAAQADPSSWRYRPWGVPVAFWTLWVLVIVAVGSKSVANYAAVLFLAFAVWQVWSHRGRPTVADRAAHAWLVCAAAAFVILFAAAMAWGDRLVYPLRVGRLLPGAVAAWLLVRHAAAWGSIGARRRMLHGFALACLLALAETYVNGRETTTNALPWAICAAMFAAALAPRILDPQFPAVDRMGWAACVVIGMVGVSLSLSRGAFGIWLWVAAVWVVLSFKSSRRKRFVATSSALLLVMALAAVVAIYRTGSETQRLDRAENVGDRLQRAIAEATHAIERPAVDGNADTSIGSRFVLWGIAAQAFRESPVVGVGIGGLHRRIEEEAARRHSNMLRDASDQAHNEYLQMAAAYGLFGLTANLLILFGLLIASARVRSDDPYASWQLAGVAFMHGTGGLTNVNFSQNYYGITMGLIVGLLLISRRRAS